MLKQYVLILNHTVKTQDYIINNTDWGFLSVIWLVSWRFGYLRKWKRLLDMNNSLWRRKKLSQSTNVEPSKCTQCSGAYVNYVSGLILQFTFQAFQLTAVHLSLAQNFFPASTLGCPLTRYKYIVASDIVCCVLTFLDNSAQRRISCDKSDYKPSIKTFSIFTPASDEVLPSTPL